MTLTWKCPHHGIPEHELAQIFYQGFDCQERQLVDISSGGNFLNTRANESLKKMQELVEDWVFRQSSMIDVRTGGVKRGVIDVKGMEIDVRMERLEKEMKQSLLEVTENFKYLLKDVIATIKPEANVNRVNVTSTCGNCVANDHIQDQCKAILVEQVNAFGQQPSHGNWQVEANINRNTNFGHSNGQHGFGVQNNQFKMQSQSHMTQTQQHYHQNPQFQPEQAPFHPNVPNLHPIAPNFANHNLNQNLWDTVRHLQENEKTWEEEKKLLLAHIEMMKTTQSLGIFIEERRESKNKGKIEDPFEKGSSSGQFPTKPCINPCNVSFNNNAKVFSHESFVVPSYSDELSRNPLTDEAHIDAITSLRSGKVLSNIVPIKEDKIGEEQIGNQKLDDKASESISMLELGRASETVREQLIPFPNAFTKKRENIDNSPLLNILKNTSITIPLTDAIRYIPLYEKFVKELCTPSRGKKIRLSENISSILLYSLPEKKRDPRAPLIGCFIQEMEFKKVLLDTRASVNILPKLLYDKLNLKGLEPIKLELQLADGSIRAPYGRLDDVMIVVGDLAFPVDFIVTDVKIIGELCNAPIILGRPFLATARAIADFDKGKIQLRMGSSKLEIPIPNLKRIPEYIYDNANQVDQLMDNEIEYDQLIAEVLAIEVEEECDDNVTSIAKSPHKRDLKPLPESLKYVFLEEGNYKPIIISSLLTQEQEKKKSNL